jgi:hypothetical protein
MRLGPWLSFSWWRASGLSAMKGRISRQIGVAAGAFVARGRKINEQVYAAEQ